MDEFKKQERLKYGEELRRQMQLNEMLKIQQNPRKQRSGSAHNIHAEVGQREQQKQMFQQRL